MLVNFDHTIICGASFHTTRQRRRACRPPPPASLLLFSLPPVRLLTAMLMPRDAGLRAARWAAGLSLRRGCSARSRVRSAGLWLLRVRRVCRLLCEGAECVDPVWMWAVCGDGFVRARWRRRSSEVRGWWLVRVPVPYMYTVQ